MLDDKGTRGPWILLHDSKNSVEDEHHFHTPLSRASTKDFASECNKYDNPPPFLLHDHQDCLVLPSLEGTDLYCSERSENHNYVPLDKNDRNEPLIFPELKRLEAKADLPHFTVKLLPRPSNDERFVETLQGLQALGPDCPKLNKMPSDTASPRIVVDNEIDDEIQPGFMHLQYQLNIHQDPKRETMQQHLHHLKTPISLPSEKNVYCLLPSLNQGNDMKPASGASKKWSPDVSSAFDTFDKNSNGAGKSSLLL
jgi:hypothetical protein